MELLNDIRSNIRYVGGSYWKIQINIYYTCRLNAFGVVFCTKEKCF